MKDLSKGIPQKWRLFFKLFCYLSPQNIPQDSIESTFMFEQVSFKGSWSVSRGTGQFQGEQVSFKGRRSVSRGTGQFQGEQVSFKGNRSVSGEQVSFRGTGQFQGEQGFAGTNIAIRNVLGREAVYPLYFGATKVSHIYFIVMPNICARSEHTDKPLCML